MKFLFFFLLAVVVFWRSAVFYLQKNSPIKDEILILTSSNIDDNKGVFMIAHIGTEVPTPSLFVLSGKLKVSVPDGYGEYELGAVLPLLTLEKKDTTYTRAVFSRILGVPVQSFLAVDSAQDVGALKKQIFTKLSQFTIPWYELAVLPLLEKNPEQLQVASVEEAQKKLQKDLIRVVSRSELMCTLAIVNTTDQTGLARELATVLEQSGVRVVRITDTSASQEHSVLKTDGARPECAWIVPLVRSWFFSEIDVVQSTDAEKTYRAWGVVFIGTDAR